MVGNSILSATNLSCRYNGKEVIGDLNISLQAGDILGLLGANGVGKTTTLKILAGVFAPHCGSVKICGHDIALQPIAAKSNLGYLPEEAPLYSDVTVDEYLDFCAAIRNVPISARPNAIDSAKQRCGLADVGKRLIANLSKGYKQRIGIAQAIVHNPAVLILDEPTNGLDPNQIRDVRELVQDLAAASQGLIISTHLLAEVQTLCNKVAILHAGRFAYQGALDKHQQTMVVELAPSPPLEFFESVVNVSKVIAFDGRRVVLDCNDRQAVTDAIIAHSVERGLSVVEITSGQSHLEQLFFDITSGNGGLAND